MNCLYLYSHDASGIGLLTEVRVLDLADDTARVSFVQFTPPLNCLTEVEWSDGERIVPASGLQSLDPSTAIGTFIGLTDD